MISRKNDFWFSSLIEQKLNIKARNWLDEMGVKNYTFRPDGTIDVDGNVDLTNKNLDKIPVKFGKVSGWFNCSRNRLTTLGGCPKEAEGGFDCSRNRLTTLEGCPREAGRSFYCHNNQLTTLKGGPRKVEWNFDCSSNAKKFTEEEVRKYCKVNGNILA